MADTAASAARDPFSSTEVRTIEITGPIKITLTTKYDASHVPPSPEAREGASGIMDALQPIAEAILQKLEEIRQNQNPQ